MLGCRNEVTITGDHHNLIDSSSFRERSNVKTNPHIDALLRNIKVKVLLTKVGNGYFACANLFGLFCVQSVSPLGLKLFPSPESDLAFMSQRFKKLIGPSVLLRLSQVGLSDKMCAFLDMDSRSCLGLRRDSAR